MIAVGYGLREQVTVFRRESVVIVGELFEVIDHTLFTVKLATQKRVGFADA